MEGLLILAGVCFGVSVMILIRRATNIGVLRIDQSDPDDEPYLFLELDKPVYTFRHKRFVVLKVNDKNYLSHK